MFENQETGVVEAERGEEDVEKGGVRSAVV